ncbi:MAG: N-acetyl-gamma-glutamyl-phosphate reductase [Phycisphaeraceae bacterium]|nr:N-acetyl-gamma-glutamyl-phosphate reductase [Phycisphaeraceae bacterium]
MTHDHITVCIVGAAGYSGAELVGLLLKHPAVRLAGLFGSDRRGGTPERFDALHPRFLGETELTIEAASVEAIMAHAPDAVFLCTPHEASVELAPALRAAGVVVLDLSAAFRLRSPSLYPEHYGFEHGASELLESAVYGLPELRREEIRHADLIACPGCYPTSVILPVAPIRAAGLLREGGVLIVDSASGVSGAGRTPSLKSLFCEVSYQPYGVLQHRHAPEMAQECGVEVLFTPHLLPLDRGIVSTIHPALAPGVAAADLRACLRHAYAEAPFVRVLPEGRWPSIASVVHTNYCDIAVGSDRSGRHAVIVSAIDNLLKGAAGQAVQAFNIRFDLPEGTALSSTPLSGVSGRTS